MRIIIIEDELVAAEKLVTMVKSIDPGIEILAVLESVVDTVQWLQSHDPPDLAFLDVQLSDNLSFDIFKQVSINFPVIFITAFDDYILKSFEHNSIDYLLKPVKEDRLRKALEKVKLLEWHFVQNKINQLIGRGPETDVSEYKSRFVVKKGIDFVSVNVQKIAYFFSEHKISFLKDVQDNKYIVDKPLAVLENELDPKKFFRLNRKFLVSINAIEKFKSEDGRISVDLTPPSSEEIYVSKENAPNFRNWIGG